MTNPRAGVQLRTYVHEEDYERVNRFLIEVYEPGAAMVAWLQPRWEYMHSHNYVDDVDLGRIGIAERGGDIVGLVHPEHSMAFVTSPDSTGASRNGESSHRSRSRQLWRPIADARQGSARHLLQRL